VARVEGTALAKMGSAEDVLKQLPRVVQRNGELEVLGKGTPLIYIDNKKIKGNVELDRLGSSDIKHVEIITEPGAEYDATYNAVIKIKTARKKGDGFGLQYRQTYERNHQDNHREVLDLTYRHRGLDIFSTLYGGLFQLQQDQHNDNKLYGKTLMDIKEDLTIKNKYYYTSGSLGFNYVFDTDFAADLTIMEEGSEFIDRFTHRNKHHWPMFTSCCPGWVRFLKSQYPEMTGNLSTAKSPQQMFGAVAKSYFAEKVGIDPKRLFVVSIMPCVAKKSECALPTMKNDAGDPDVDVSITTRELGIMMRANHIEPKYLPEEEFDSPLGSSTGAAVVFGATGGVMDAALRSAHFLVTGKNPDPDAFTAVRGMDGWKEATFNIPGAGNVRVAVVSSLGNARKLLDAVKCGDAAYDFVEVMACPGGCAGGGGQPIHDGEEHAEDRGNVLWRLDQDELLRFSHENPDVKALYKDYLGAPLGEKSHHLLHTDHNAWQMPQKML